MTAPSKPRDYFATTHWTVVQARELHIHKASCALTGFLVASSECGSYIARCQSCADVAKLADAQPSEGCDRKVVEVQLLSSAPTMQGKYEAT